MKFEIFLIFLSFCLYLASGKTISNADSDDEVELSDGDNSDFGSDFGDDSDDIWFSNMDDKPKIIEEAPKIDSKPIEPNDQSAIETTDQKASQTVNVEKSQKLGTNDVNENESMQSKFRIQDELEAIKRSASFKSGAYSIELVNDSVYEWNVFLRSVDPDSELYKDLLQWKEQSGQNYIHLNIQFSKNFPTEPPFVRIISPVIRGRHVMRNGAIFMEMITNHGWNEVYTMETVLMQAAASLASAKTRIPKQDKDFAKQEYDLERALQNFKSVNKFIRHDKQ